MEKNGSVKIFSNMIWRFAERCSSQGVSFIVSIILARLLEPEHYGSIALVTVLTTFLRVFVDSGFGSALIQKKGADNTDFSTVFFFNMGICSALYIGLFFCAPYIASFYNNVELTPVIRVMGLTLIISGVTNIQVSYVSKNLIFKNFFISTLLGTISSAVIGIVLAYLGYGIWALVAQHISSSAINMIVLWFTVKWRPSFTFSISRFKSLFSFGWKILVSQLLETAYNDIRQLIIGKMYSSSDLSFYNKGKQLPYMIISNINTSISSVLLPSMSREQDQKSHVKAMMRRSIKTSVFILAPFLVGLFSVSKPLISVLYTDKWISCVPYLRVFCLTYILYPVHTSNLSAIKAMGRSDLFLRLEIIKKIVGLILLASTVSFGPLVMAYSLLISTITSSFINAFPNKKLLDYSYFEQIKDILPALVLSALMGVLVYSVQLLNLSNLVTLLIQVPLGIAVYVLGAIIFKIDSFYYALSVLKGFLKGKKN